MPTNLKREEIIMFKKIMFILLAGASIGFFGCTSVEYDGSTFAPTTKVKVFYDKSRIKRQYEVMGTATASTWYSYQNNSLRPALIEKAKACGADAILVQSISQSIGPKARVATDDEIDDGRMEANNPGVKTEDNMLLPDQEGHQTSVAVDTSQIVAKFLKFK